ncbi:MAG: Ribosomal RNA small subunit methyltransferase F [Ignavibacteriaceae bacterium]|nr:Ribosomal RNA small subunit methyltransferase F [Ignavibacteriaceae bacterium]
MITNRNYTPFSDQVRGYFDGAFGRSWTERYDAFLMQEPAEYIRVNPARITPEGLKERLQNQYAISSEVHPLIPLCLKIDDPEGLAGKTIEHILGYYYIQSLSSMIPPLVLNPSEEDKVLDLCAAPGSKTTQLAALMNNRGTLIANDIAAERVKSLAFNTERMNVMNAAVLHGKGEMLSKIFHSWFDKILVDVPCSGLGVLQKKGEINKWWTTDSVKNLAEIQYRLLVSAAKMLRQGGELVYSTCTLTVEENEQVLDQFLRKFPFKLVPVEIPLKSEAGRALGDNQELHNTRRLIPWEVNSEGFFVAKLIKEDEIPGDSEGGRHHQEQYKTGGYKKFQKDLEYLHRYFGITPDVLNEYTYYVKSGEYQFIHRSFNFHPEAWFSRAGLKLGSADKYGNFILSSIAAQVFNDAITSHLFEITDLRDLKEYMAGGTIKIDSAQKGQVAVKYDGTVIGTATITPQGLKSRFPRTLRTQKIIFGQE